MTDHRGLDFYNNQTLSAQSLTEVLPPNDSNLGNNASNT